MGLSGFWNILGNILHGDKGAIYMTEPFLDAYVCAPRSVDRENNREDISSVETYQSSKDRLVNRRDEPPLRLIIALFNPTFTEINPSL